MMHGKFITLEGTEGAGKSTALRYIQAELERYSLDVLVTREPGGTEIAEEIRKVLLHTATEEKMQPETELLLMFAGRLQHIKSCIEPALKAGKWVVSDRYIDASYAYQSGGRGIPVEKIELLDKFVVGSMYPQLTLLLDLPAEVGFARAEKRSSVRDRIEQEKIDFFERVRNAYLVRAKQDPQRIKVIDASKSLAEVKEQISDTINKFINV